MHMAGGEWFGFVPGSCLHSSCLEACTLCADWPDRSETSSM